MACLPLQDCPQVNEIALKIQQLGDFQADKKIELLNLINDKLCGGRINKHLLVCCDKVEVPPSASDNNNRGYVCIYLFSSTTRIHSPFAEVYAQHTRVICYRGQYWAQQNTYTVSTMLLILFPTQNINITLYMFLHEHRIASVIALKMLNLAICTSVTSEHGMNYYISARKSRHRFRDKNIQ